MKGRKNGEGGTEGRRLRGGGREARRQGGRNNEGFIQLYAIRGEGK